VECETTHRRGAEGKRPLSRRTTLFAVASLVCVLVALGGGRTAQAQTTYLGAEAASSPQRTKQSNLLRADPWSVYLADADRCPGADVVGGPPATQLKAMSCLINYARTTRGLRKLASSRKLSLAARLKAEQIERCGVFDHAPCGGTPWAVAERAGYAGSFGENLYIGETTLGSAREALKEWLGSRPHRANMFSKSWRVDSLYAMHVDRLDGFVDATVWIAQFGDR